MYQPSETLRLEVKLEDETVWLTQAQMSELFLTTRNNITLHLRNIFKESELEENSVCKESLLTASDGKRYMTKFYNLDVIISVGYRVKSQRGTQFRIWANKILKEYLLRGYSVNRHMVALQEHVDARLQLHDSEIADLQEKVGMLVDMHSTPPERLFPNGCVFDAWAHLAGLVREAKDRIVLIDNYCDERTLEMLAKRQTGVAVTIHTRYSKPFLSDLQKHNEQYPDAVIEFVQLSQGNHDRFLIIDDSVYILGDSMKNLGHTLSAILKTSFSPGQILSNVK